MPSPEDKHPNKKTTTTTESSSSSSSSPIQSRLRQSDRDHLAAIDALIERMRTLTPSDPYRLTIPQEKVCKYQYTWQFQVTQWRENTPFTSREHDTIQYQTFIYHDPSRSMYQQISLRPEEDPPRPVGKVGTPVPGFAPKKTISFGTYKKKQAGEHVSGDEKDLKKDRVQDEVKERSQAWVEAKKAAVKSPAERAKVDEEVLDDVQEMGQADEPAHSVEQSDKDGRHFKRKRVDVPTKRESEDPQSQQSVEHEQPLLKRARKSQPPTTSKNGIVAGDEKHDTPAERSASKASEKSIPSAASKHAVKSPRDTPTPESEAEESWLPPRLSPLHHSSELPPRLSPLHNSELPPRLSPTLPDNIMATLKARSEFRSTSTPNGLPKDDRLTPTKKADAMTKHKSPIPRNGFRANSSSPAVALDTADRVPRVTSKQGPGEVTPDASPEEEIVVSQRDKGEANGSDGKSLVVKLQLPIKQLRAFQASEKQSAKAAAAASNPIDQRQRDKRDLNAKGVAQKIGPTPNAVTQSDPKPSNNDKRPRGADADDSDPAHKRRKASPEPDPPDNERKAKKAPTTPLPAERPSSSMPGSSQKATPGNRKDALSNAMRREMSASSTNTPSGHPRSPAAIGPNPSSTSTASSSHPRSSAANRNLSNHTPLQQAWENEQKRLEALGRELKHAATAHHTAAEASSASSPDTKPARSKSRKLAAITSLESLIAYILAFTASDEAARSADPSLPPSLRPWRTLAAYIGFVKKHCEPFPQLHVLASALGVAFTSRVLDIAARYPASEKDHGSSSSASSISPAAMHETTSLLMRCSTEVEGKLDLDTLQSLYPETWRGRLKASSGGAGIGSAGTASEKLKPSGDWAGAYRLPLGVATPPFCVARAVGRMLREWIARESVPGGYEGRVKI